jgi:hypothetical protein
MRGAKDVFRAIQGLGPLVGEFEGPRYNRLDHVLRLRQERALDEDLRWRQAAIPAH